MTPPSELLMVCSGNICRSPMAEVLARAWLEREPAGAGTGVGAGTGTGTGASAAAGPQRVGSASTFGIDGHPADPLAVAAAAEIGLDLSRHRSRPLTRDLLASGATIVVMAEHHAEFALELDPTCGSRIVRLWHWSPAPNDAGGDGRGGEGGGGDGRGEGGGTRAAITEIFDPIGRPLESFRACRDLIDACLRAWLPSRAAGDPAGRR